MLAAIDEMRTIISRSHPEATYETYLDLEGASVWLRAVVDVDDTDDVVDLYIKRLLDLQSEEGVRLHVLPVRTPERIERDFQEMQRAEQRRSASAAGG
jgi:hypothetical protein